MEPLGWDGEGRIYYVLDDDRMYRRTDPNVTIPKQKSQAKKASSANSSKKRKTATGIQVSDADSPSDNVISQSSKFDLLDPKWECVAISVDEYMTFVESIRRSRIQDERTLHSRLVKQVMPIIEKRAEEQLRKVLRRQKQAENMAKLATAKRSSRIAGKMEQKKVQEEAEEAERKRKTNLENARKEEQRLRKFSEVLQSYLLSPCGLVTFS